MFQALLMASSRLVLRGEFSFHICQAATVLQCRILMFPDLCQFEWWSLQNFDATQKFSNVVDHGFIGF